MQVFHLPVFSFQPRGPPVFLFVSRMFARARPPREARSTFHPGRKPNIPTKSTKEPRAQHCACDSSVETKSKKKAPPPRCFPALSSLAPESDRDLRRFVNTGKRRSMILGFGLLTRLVTLPGLLVASQDDNNEAPHNKRAALRFS